MRLIHYTCLIVLLVAAGCAGGKRHREVQRVPEGHSMWNLKEVEVTREQAKAIAIREIGDRKPGASVDGTNAHLSVAGNRPQWNVSPAGLGDVSWQVTVDAISGEVTFAYVVPGR